MKFFSNSYAKRRTVLVAMPVWLSAFASGMANGCLLESSGTHAHATKHRHSEATHGSRLSTADAMADDDHDADASKETCLKTCDDGSNAPVKLNASFGLSDPVLGPVVAIAWNAATPAVLAPSRMQDLQPPSLGPPVRVRYSRLALLPLADAWLGAWFSAVRVRCCAARFRA